ncbi:MAG: hypothetical protein HOP11_07930 [Saprospiraceae bacterium]|nr:hypothetical protein [Saprospiraceae bacterium]
MRKNTIYKRISLILAVAILNQVFYPTVALALTEGPSQPEAKGFQPIGLTDMVDMFTGDFKYNIPLCQVGNYPINLSYSASPGVEEEASWVGLGWSLNPGMISRNMRGLPDDFKGDSITRRFNMKRDETWGVSPGVSAEIWGFTLGANTGVFFNNYKGWGFEAGVSPSLKIGSKNSGQNTSGLALSGNFSYNSQSGIGIGAGVGFWNKSGNEQAKSTTLGLNGYNSRQGLKELGWNFSTNMINLKVLDKLANGSISFGSPTYTPVPELPLSNSSYTLRGTVGGDFIGIHPNLSITGYYTGQKPSTNLIRKPAYGYHYSSDGQKIDGALQDYNRDKPTPYKPEMINISPVIGTYDLFNVTGHNGGGQFRLYRNDIGYYGETYRLNTSTSESIGLELGGGNAFHAGFDVNISNSDSKARKWTDDNNIKDKLNFKSKLTTGASSEIAMEPSYFAMVDEPVKYNSTFFNKSGGKSPSRVRIDKYGNKVVAERSYVKEQNLLPAGETGVPSEIYESTRQARSQVVTALTSMEAFSSGLDKNIVSYFPNNFNYGSCTPNPPLIESRMKYPRNHFSEFNIVNTDGSRNVYGIPVYNNFQREVTFSTGNTPNAENIVTISTNDDTHSNSKGDDNYFNSEETPAYATSYLLTGVLSPDYHDRTGNGITPDDLGNAIKFNYSCVKDYKWRNPLGSNTARFNPGNRTDNGDNKASYVYGSKDIWYMHSIETNMEVAHFHTSARTDALGVTNQTGTIQTSTNFRMRKLDSIRIYSKSDLVMNGNNAVPLKTIVFEYETTETKQLCRFLPNAISSTQGKLTLKAVYVKYLKNNVKYNLYQFKYNDAGTLNPNYGINSQDRWGSYRDPSQVPNALDLPYTWQNATHALNSSKVYNIDSILLPSGGAIKVNYEPDDYAYVMNKRAGQMMLINGFKKSGGSTVANLFNSSGDVNDYLVVSLPTTVTSVNELKQRYFENVDQLYFNFNVDITGNNQSEYVSGYMDFNKNGLVLVGNSTVEIPITKLTSDRGTMMHPVTKAANQMMRINLQKLAFPMSLSGNILKSMVGFIGDIGIMVSGFDDKFMKDGYSKKVTLSKSYVRLANPNYAKIGGGSRVKSLTIDDRWASMDVNASSASYTKEYTYKTKAIVNGVAADISSGVASWEPALGNEENLFRTPLPYKQEVLLAPDNSFYTENPIGEGMFPGPSVGYSEIKERNVTSRTDGSSNGFMVYKYYTAKDFPTLVYRTKKESKRAKSNPVLKFFKISNYNFETVSQGFVVEVNNMHGKMKEESSYNEKGVNISYKRIEYLLENATAENKQLKNLVSTIGGVQTNDVVSNEMGVKQDVWQEFSEESNKTEGLGVAFNTEGFFAAIFPVVVPIPIPIIQKEETRLRWASTTKYIYRQGIVAKEINSVDGATITTENLYFDTETGNPIVTSVENEYGKKVYKTTYPAHWAYKRMGFAYKNVNMECDEINYNSGGISNPNSTFYNALEHGDEIALSNVYKIFGFKIKVPVSGRYFIAVDGSNKYIYNLSGSVMSGSGSVKILRSGNRNMANLPVYSYSSLNNPVSALKLANTTDLKILDASASDYKDQWAVEERVINKVNCDEVIYAYADTFLRNRLIPALVDKDLHWISKYNDNIYVSNVVQSKFPGYPGTVTWLGKQINSIRFYKITPSIGSNAYLYEAYEAALNDNCRLIIEPYVCVLPIKDPKKVESRSNQAIPPCTPFDIRYLKVASLTPCDISAGVIKLDTFNIANCDFRAYVKCIECKEKAICTKLLPGDTINIFTNGLSGNFRMHRNYRYHTRRQSNDIVNTGAVLANDGYFRNYTHIWNFVSGQLTFGNPAPGYWDTISTATKYNSRGVELENYNVVNIPSAAVFGYDRNLSTIVGKNVRLRNIAYDGAEDWGFDNACNPVNTCYENTHFDFYDANSSTKRSTIFSHSGKYSIRINNNDSITSCQPLFGNPNDGLYQTQSLYSFSGSVYRINSDGILPRFYPETGVYVVSAWVRKDTSTAVSSIRVKTNNCCNATGGNVKTLLPSGPIVEGWQRIYDTITVPLAMPCAGTTRSIAFTLHSTGYGAYFDDFRVHPFYGNIQTYVYDDYFGRLSATLDQNNYATFYEYDDAGNLIRLKKETEKGIMTIKEHRQYLKTER